MILMIDNYDSFTYNLVQYLRELGEAVVVRRNDQLGLEEVRQLDPDRIVLSPGPCTPAEAGISCDLVRAFGASIPLLGVCLGHQCIGEAYGAVVAGAGEIKHGKMSQVSHDGKGVFAGLPNPFAAVRYHSLAIVPETLPAVLEVSARSESGVIMGVRHRELTLEGVQFHPESILTKPGKQLLANFLRMQNRVKAGAS
jgi:anthranilate synthase/aminodeoxychorismate synthase-like glutamine amidotransferase